LAAWEAAQATRPSVAATLVMDDDGGAGDVTAGQLWF
ncbi:MAG: glutathione S-transferase, partial [Rhodobacteraceae bacterium]|nr:glutathione S-transferase [Paracoccaceae bacterium]